LTYAPSDTRKTWGFECYNPMVMPGCFAFSDDAFLVLDVEPMRFPHPITAAIADSVRGIPFFSSFVSIVVSLKANLGR
jgi:hypothetical protein